jgi:hypothetical protein
MRVRKVIAVVPIALAAMSIIVAPAFASGVFPDVPANHPYVDAIENLAGKGIIGGYENGNFGPGVTVTRQQFAKMIVGTGGYPVSETDICTFADVKKGDAATFYPDNFVAVCAAKGITTGTTATTFNPTGKITRYQVVSMVVRTANDLQPSLLTTPPDGWTATGKWGNNSTHGANAARAEYNGLLLGLDLKDLDPAGDMTRGEVAQVLSRLLSVLEPICPLQIVSARYDAPGDDNSNLNEEYITFKVLTPGSLAGYAVEDEYGWHYEFPDRVVPVGQFFKLHTGAGADTQTDLYWGKTSAAIWNNDGDTIKVLDSGGHIVASYRYQD